MLLYGFGYVKFVVVVLFISEVYYLFEVIYGYILGNIFLSFLVWCLVSLFNCRFFVFLICFI